MKVGDAITEILKREGIETIIGYPVNHLLEYAAMADIRPIIVRQERTGIHMADAMSRLSSGRKLGVFVMQVGPGTENSYGAIAQAFSESVPILVMPGGYARRLAHIEPNYNATLSMRSITKSAEPLNVPADIPSVMRRAFSRLRNGRGGPVLVEIPTTSGTRRCRSRSTTAPCSRPAAAPIPRRSRRRWRCWWRPAGR